MTSKTALEAWNVAVEACNETHGTGGWDDYQICDSCGVQALSDFAADALGERK